MFLYIVTGKIARDVVLFENLFYGTPDDVSVYLDAAMVETSADTVSATLADDWVSFGVSV